MSESDFVSQTKLLRSLTLRQPLVEALRGLSDRERAALERSILLDGCIKDSLVAWQRPDGQLVLVDGHHRYTIWNQNLQAIAPPKVDVREFRDEAAAIEWVEQFHVGRRNLQPKELADLCEKYAAAAVAEAKENQRKAGRRRRKNALADPAKALKPVQREVREPNDSAPKHADKIVQDRVEAETGQRPARKVARDAIAKTKPPRKPRKPQPAPQPKIYQPSKSRVPLATRRLVKLIRSIEAGTVRKVNVGAEVDGIISDLTCDILDDYGRDFILAVLTAGRQIAEIDSTRVRAFFR